MTDARSTQRGEYFSDTTGKQYTRRVDAHLFSQAVLGWGSPNPADDPLPGSMRPRHVVGVDPSGRSHSVVVAKLDADLWAAPRANTWTILDDTGATVTVTPTGLVGESLTL